MRRAPETGDRGVQSVRQAERSASQRVRIGGTGSTVREVQQGLGNQAVQRLLQARRLVGPTSDSHERQAEAVAGAVASGRAVGPPAIRRAAPASGPSEARALHGLGPGQPLGARAHSGLGSGLGQHLAHVRIHTDSQAHQAAAELHARAFTHGRDIVFGRGEYAPGTREGDRLLAHELTHVAQSYSDPRPVIRRQPISGSVPPQIDPTKLSLSVSFMVPGNKQLTSDWNDLSTTAPTQVYLELSPTGIRVSITPGFLIDAQWPVSDMEWGGLTYDFATASVTSVSLVDTQIGPGAQGTARSRIISFFTGLLAGTPAARAGYDPMTDPDPMATLRAIQGNWTSMPSGGSEVGAADVTGITVSGEVTFRTEIRQATPEGGVVIPAGATARVSVVFEGSAADVADPKRRKVSHLILSSSGITLQKDGTDMVRLERIRVSRGGAVTVERYTALGPVREAEGVESALRLLGLIAVLSQGTSADRPAVSQMQPNFDPEIVRGLTRSQLNQTLTSAVRQLIIDNANAIPGVDLMEVFGIQQMGDFPTVPPAGPGSAYG